MKPRAWFAFMAWGFALLGLIAPSLALAAASVDGIQLVSTVRASRTHFDYTYQVTVRNGSPALSAATATVQSSAAPATTVIKGTVVLGDLAVGATVVSADTFTIRQDRSLPFNPASLSWAVTGTPVVATVTVPDVRGLTQAAAASALTGRGLVPGAETVQNSDSVPLGHVIDQNPAAGASVALGSAVSLFVSAGPTSTPRPAALEARLSEPVVAPDGSVTVTPTVRDANGAPMSGDFQFTLAVTAVGPVSGNAPVVDGLTVRFPKLAKRLLNPNPTIDPNGDYADGDPTDPNYGKETGGKYRVTLRLVGGSLSSSQDVLVLPSGTAHITAKTSQYAGRLEEALAAALQATQANDAVALAQARTAFQALSANADFSQTVLSATQAMAPPNGNLAIPAFLSARGFVAGPQDAAFATALGTVVTRLRAARTQLEAINTAALTQDSLNTLQAAAASYKQAVQQLQTLQPSALGTAQQNAAINQQIATEVPLLLDVIKRKTGELMTQVVVSAPAAAGTALALGAPSSARAMYAGTRPVQLFTFWSFAFSTFTDLSGTARANIIELTVTLVNSLINISAANAINQNPSGGVYIDYCLASSSLAYVCPNYMPTTVGGSGFGRNPAAVKVALVGCLGGDLIRNLMTLRVPGDLAARIRLGNKVISITNSLAQQGGVGAVVQPDFIDEDYLMGNSDLLFFNRGWPRVNQGRLPCVGIVIVMNTETGGIAAVNLNFLGVCG